MSRMIEEPGRPPLVTLAALAPDSATAAALAHQEAQVEAEYARLRVEWEHYVRVLPWHRLTEREKCWRDRSRYRSELLHRSCWPDGYLSMVYEAMARRLGWRS